MSQTLVPHAASFESTSLAADRAPSTTWASPGDDLWVASRPAARGLQFLGFVERSLDDFIAVDGSGTSMGRHADLAAAQRAVVAAHAPSGVAPASWSETGAPVLSVSALRSR